MRLAPFSCEEFKIVFNADEYFGPVLTTLQQTVADKNTHGERLSVTIWTIVSSWLIMHSKRRTGSSFDEGGPYFKSCWAFWCNKDNGRPTALCILAQECKWMLARFIQGCTLWRTLNRVEWKLGLYISLPVPLRPCGSMSLDFLSGCPRSSMDMITSVIVDRFSKMVLCIPCKKYNLWQGGSKTLFWARVGTFKASKFHYFWQEQMLLEQFLDYTVELVELIGYSSVAQHSTISQIDRPRSHGRTELVNHTSAFVESL